MQENTFQRTPPIFSQDLKTKGQTYFFDVREAKNGSKYVSISQSWISNGQGHRGNITVFKNDLEQFLEIASGLLDKVA